MRKLLIILLLLFPVHGAWGKNIINLTCIVQFTKNPSTTYFVIDYDNNLVTNPRGNPFANTLINDQIIQFDTPDNSKEPTTKSMTYTIDRVNGSIKIFFENTKGKTSLFEGNCKKSSDKKKF